MKVQLAILPRIPEISVEKKNENCRLHSETELSGLFQAFLCLKFLPILSFLSMENDNWKLTHRAGQSSVSFGLLLNLEKAYTTHSLTHSLTSPPKKGSRVCCEPQLLYNHSIIFLCFYRAIFTEF